MQRQQNNLVQLGVAIVILGIAVKVAVLVGMVLSPAANFAIVAGVIVAIIGLVKPGRGY